MNPFIHRVKCSVCGEEGMAHAKDADYLWLGQFTHSDSTVCAENLRRKERRQAVELAKLKEAEEQKSEELRTVWGNVG